MSYADDLRKELQLKDKQRQRMAAALETKVCHFLLAGNLNAMTVFV